MKKKPDHRGNPAVAILPLLILVALYLLEFDTGHVHRVDVRVSESEIYSMEEIEEAASVLKCYFFLHMPGYELRKLTYEEEKAYPELLARAGEASPLGRVIIFDSVLVKVHSYDGTGENNREQSRKWILVRDSDAGKWRIDTSGR